MNEKKIIAVVYQQVDKTKDQARITGESVHEICGAALTQFFEFKWAFMIRTHILAIHKVVFPHELSKIEDLIQLLLRCFDYCFPQEIVRSQGRYEEVFHTISSLASIGGIPVKEKLKNLLHYAHQVEIKSRYRVKGSVVALNLLEQDVMAHMNSRYW
jgi:hypothetical protein